MKKILLFLILLFIPISIFAREGISNYYVDATILNNGDLSVKELIVLNGKFNGYERIINFINPYAKEFDGSLESFGGSDIYNANDIELISIKEIDISNGYTFDSIFNEGLLFTKNDYAEIGDYGVYQEFSDGNSNTFRIYNPSNGYLKGFYLEYILKDMAVVFNDTADLGWNLFSSGALTEYINEYELHLNIPNNTNLRAWAHGPLNGEVNLVGTTQVVVKINEVNPGTTFDVRSTFDKNVVNISTKLKNINAMDSILKVEQKLADDANNARNYIKIVYYALMIISVVWIIVLIGLIIYMYLKYDKERSSSFQVKYFREFPASYGPEIVGYLFAKNIGNKELSASIVNLVYKKVIAYEEISPKKYVLKYSNPNIEVTPSEKHLLEWLFIKIGEDGVVNIDEINKNAKSDYDSFLTNYNVWKRLSMDDAKTQNFFETQAAPKFLSALYSLFGILIAIYNLNSNIFPELSTLMIVLAVVAFIYFATITKRTEKGNEEYVRWKGLKNFLNDFGRFKDRDLPMITLWEKYLVYAMVFGIAEKLAKTMTIKFAELNKNNTMPNAFDIHYINSMMLLNRSINSGVNNAISTATSMSAAAHSRSASGGGFGGGFSSGGGSFGGGGGGGRF